MRLSDILSTSRTVVVAVGSARLDKRGALEQLAQLLAQELPVDAGRLTELLAERERLQSTGIGEGVAVPHSSLEEANRQVGALLLCPEGVPFDSVDGEPARIIFGVVGPRRLTGEHLKILARVSRLLRNPDTRRELLELQSPVDVIALIEARERALS